MVASENWNEEAMSDQSGKVAIITGSNTGIGFYMARALARKGATVTMACRDMAKAEKSRKMIVGEFPGCDISTSFLDLANLSSIEEFAKEFPKERGLHILINNAGVMIPPKSKTRTDLSCNLALII